jgi:1-acyl-sn-glycerol-3-phosphate acyltransferase
LADADQINRFFIRWLARRVQVLPIPAVTKDKPQTISQIRRVMEQCAAILRQGDNLLLYPAGGICRQSQEKIGNHSAVHTILQQAPQVRVVLVRTSGLWGSGFSWASGQAPVVGPALRQGIKSLLLNGIFFTPRRPVDIELVEPADFPRSADRPTINRYLEKFYNLPIQPSTCVPYTIWQKNSNQV